MTSTALPTLAPPCCHTHRWLDTSPAAEMRKTANHTAAWSDEGKLLGLVTRTDVLRERKLYASVGGTGQRRVR